MSDKIINKIYNIVGKQFDLVEDDLLCNYKVLINMTAEDLKKRYNLTKLQASRFKDALELTYQVRNKRQDLVKPKITSSQKVFNLMHPKIGLLHVEEFWILILNRANDVTRQKRISVGGVTATVVDIRIILKHAIDSLASAIILCHNHPSGNLKPSQPDIDLTRKIKQAGNSMDILVLDHLIITEDGYYSFADEGIL